MMIRRLLVILRLIQKLGRKLRVPATAKKMRVSPHHSRDAELRQRHADGSSLIFSCLRPTIFFPIFVHYGIEHLIIIIHWHLYKKSANWLSKCKFAWFGLLLNLLWEEHRRVWWLSAEWENISGCLEKFWRLAIENNPRIFRRKTAGLLTPKTGSRAARYVFPREQTIIIVHS